MTETVGPVPCIHVANGVCHKCEQPIDWAEAEVWRAEIGWGRCLQHPECP